MMRSHVEAKGGTGVKCYIRNKYEELSTGENGEQKGAVAVSWQQL